jgi:hypothetical protein
MIFIKYINEEFALYCSSRFNYRLAIRRVLLEGWRPHSYFNCIGSDIVIAGNNSQGIIMFYAPN